jgi:hypothetical protein
VQVDQLKVTVRDSLGGEEVAQVVLEEDGDTCTVSLTCASFTGRATAEDYFEAFAQIRTELGVRDLAPLCYGASRDVYPSPMSIQMSGGLKAYRMTLGKQALTEDLVNIFDSGPGLDPASPQEQRAFHKEWIASLGQKSC